MRHFKTLLLVSLLCAVLAASMQGQAVQSKVASDDHGDPTLKAMLVELKRSQESLQLGQLQRPYYIDYEVTEYQDYSVDATLGALLDEQKAIGRLIRVVVRIGDYKQDSYFGEGQGTLEGMIPIDDNEMALRHQLWLATDKAYKAALSGLTEKQAALRNVQVENEIADFSEEKPAQSFRPIHKIDLNSDSWTKTLRSVSDIFRADAGLEHSDATLNCRILNRYFVSTEGTVTRGGQVVYSLGYSGSAQAPDGMRLDRSQAYVTAKADELPSPEQIKKDAQKLIGTFEALRKAPVVEDDYHGPVLFSADASTALFERLIMPNILGNRPENLGTGARTSGEFASYYKSRVMPDFFTVVDDPRTQKIDGLTLTGSYDVDDEGVKAEPVTVIDKGVLVNYLVSREPIRDFPHSSGRGRSGYAGPPKAQISNLIFKANNGVSFDELKKKLIGMCRDQGRPYGYYVETTGPRLAPRLLWRVYVSDGHMELVRGANFNQLDTRTLRNNVIAAGNDTYVYNRRDPVPSSIVAPSMLFDDLEIQRLNRSREKMPSYPPPALITAGK